MSVSTFLLAASRPPLQNAQGRGTLGVILCATKSKLGPPAHPLCYLCPTNQRSGPPARFPFFGSTMLSAIGPVFDLFTNRIKAPEA